MSDLARRYINAYLAHESAETHLQIARDREREARTALTAIASDLREFADSDGKARIFAAVGDTCVLLTGKYTGIEIVTIEKGE